MNSVWIIALPGVFKLVSTNAPLSSQLVAYVNSIAEMFNHNDTIYLKVIKLLF